MRLFLQSSMEWSLFQDSEKTIHSAEKMLPYMKAFILWIDKNTKKLSQVKIVENTVEWTWVSKHLNQL